MKPVPMMHRFSFKIIAGLLSMLILVGIPFFIAFLRYHRSQLLETLENSTSSMSRVLTHQLEVSVLERRNHELGEIVARLSNTSDVRQIMVIDNAEKVAASSDRSQVGRKLSRHNEPGCRECHQSVVLKDTIYLSDSQGQPYYRNVTVIQNRPACHSCHDPASAVNGIFVMDFSQDILQRQYRASLYRLLAMAGAMLLLTIGVLYILLNYLVLRRLRRFAEAAEEIGHSKFDRVLASGKDEFGQLAASFNLMSQRLESAMKEVQDGRNYLESVINNVDDEILVLNRDFEIVTSNAAYLRRNDGEDPEKARPGGTRSPDGSIFNKHPTDTCACKLTFGNGRVHKILQTVLSPDGKERFIEVFCSPLRDSSGEVHRVIEVRRDITERKLLEANLAHSERLITMGLLASGLSHEINNPLASISTFVEGLQRRLGKTGGPAQGDLKGLESSLNLIQREIERARDVTRRLLILAQKDESARSLVDLNESLRETILLVQHEASKQRIRVDMDLDPAMPVLRVSEAQVRQVFLNLLLNSLQAGHSGGSVRCQTWHGEGRAYASFEDNGRGIEPSVLVKIFEPFFSRKAAGQGTGLGLFICKSIVSAWGGEITVESRVGQGARFTLWIPVQSQ